MKPWMVSFSNPDWKRVGLSDNGWLWPNQQKVVDYHLAHHPRFSMVIAPGGSGKTVEQQVMTMLELSHFDYLQRQLIIAPQQNIGQQFAKTRDKDLRISKRGNKLVWDIPDEYNFCNETSRAIIDNLKKWLRAKPTTAMVKKAREHAEAHGLIAIASHAALTRAWSELEKELDLKELKKVTRNLTLRIDESHHVSWVFVHDEPGLTKEEKAAMRQKANRLGRIVQFFLNEGHSSCRICMTTATPFRNKELIFSAGAAEKFDVLYYPLSAHWKNLHFKAFSAEVELYSGLDPIELMVKNIKEESGEKHLIVLPPHYVQKMVGWRRANSVEKLLSALRKALPGKVIKETITEEGQRMVKRMLLDKQPLDIIITCKLVREGTDWEQCSRIHHTCMETSRSLAVQTIYRMMRTHAEKNGKEVKIRYYVPKSKFKPMNEVEVKEDFSERLNATLLLSDIEDMMAPWLIASIKNPKLKAGGRPKRTTVCTDRVTMFDILGEQYAEIEREVMTAVDALSHRDEESIREVVEDTLRDVLDGVEPGIVDSIVSWYLRRWAIAARRPDIVALIEGLAPLREVFDLVGKSNMDDVSVVFGGRINAAGWKKLRKIYTSSEWTWADVYRSATCA